MSDSKFSDIPPDKPGYYWFKKNPDEPAMPACIGMRWNKSGWWIELLWHEKEDPHSVEGYPNALWYGPIEPPE